jgi:hypothetical protein
MDCYNVYRREDLELSQNNFFFSPVSISFFPQIRVWATYRLKLYVTGGTFLLHCVLLLYIQDECVTLSSGCQRYPVSNLFVAVGTSPRFPSVVEVVHLLDAFQLLMSCAKLSTFSEILLTSARQKLS